MLDVEFLAVARGADRALAERVGLVAAEVEEADLVAEELEVFVEKALEEVADFGFRDAVAVLLLRHFAPGGVGCVREDVLGVAEGLEERNRGEAQRLGFSEDFAKLGLGKGVLRDAFGAGLPLDHVLHLPENGVVSAGGGEAQQGGDGFARQRFAVEVDVNGQQWRGLVHGFGLPQARGWKRTEASKGAA